MKLAFLCSSLERGRDGVGDYSRRLGEECVKLGHHCALIALNDRHLSGGLEKAESDAECCTLRLPAGMPWNKRVAHAVAFGTEFGPDWISLQFVAYGFHPKGIVARLPRILRRIIDARRLHVMMHELWSGGGPEASPKQRLVGLVQRFFVLRMLKTLRPAVLHTSLPVCVEALGKAGIGAGLLPLFGSIPLADMSDAEPLAARLRGDGQSHGNAGGAPLIGGFFGSFYPEWRPEPLFGILQKVASKLDRPLHLVAAGRLGSYGEGLWDDLTRTYEQIHFLKLGEQPTRALSQFFQLVDFGIPTAPWHLLGKSSSAAAMLDHGLPILVSPDSHAGFRGEVATAGRPELILRCDEHLELKLLAGLPKATPSSSISQIASMFAEQLSQHENLANESNAPRETTDKPAAHR